MNEHQRAGEPANRGHEIMVRRELIGSYRDLDVYKMAMECAIRIFELTKSFPVEERFSLVD